MTILKIKKQTKKTVNGSKVSTPHKNRKKNTKMKSVCHENDIYAELKIRRGEVDNL